MNGDVTKKVVVLGNGFAGKAISRLLDDHFDVTVLDRRAAFVSKIGMVRGIVDPEFADTQIIDNTKNLSKGKTVNGVRVVEVTDAKVVTADGQEFPYEYLIVAVGALSNSPVEPVDDGKESTLEGLKAHYDGIAKAIEVSEHVAVIGGGPVGVEIVGEIKNKYPDKVITLVHSRSGLCHVQQGQPTAVSFQNKLKTDLENLGVTLKLAVKADLSPFAEDAKTQNYFTVDSKTGVKLADETVVNADLIIPTNGFVGGGSKIQGLPLDADGKVKVNDFLQVEGFTNVFALGDCNNSGDLMMSGVAGSKKGMPFGMPYGQGDLTYENIARLQAGSTTLKPLTKATSAMMLVPVGNTGGAGVGVPGMFVNTFLNAKRADYFVGPHKARLLRE